MKKLGLGLDLVTLLKIMQQGGTVNPFTRIIGNAPEELRKSGVTKAGLLGSIYIMNGDFFKRPFMAKGIDIVTPENSKKDYINRKLTEEIERGVVNKDTIDEFIAIIEEMKEKENIEVVILGTSELSLLFKGVETPVPCIDIMKSQIKKMVDEVLV